MDEGIDIFETAGNNRQSSLCLKPWFPLIAERMATARPLIELIKSYKPQGASEVPKRYVIHKCTTIRHALSAQKFGVDCLSIDGFECELV